MLTNGALTELEQNGTEWIENGYGMGTEHILNG